MILRCLRVNANYGGLNLGPHIFNSCNGRFNFGNTCNTHSKPEIQIKRAGSAKHKKLSKTLISLATILGGTYVDVKISNGVTQIKYTVHSLGRSNRQTYVRNKNKVYTTGIKPKRFKIKPPWWQSTVTVTYQCLNVSK